MNNQGCETCTYLARSALPSVGWCRCPWATAPSWLSTRRAVTIKAVQDCTGWQPPKENMVLEEQHHEP